ncbi:YncE family protein [Caulobacter sp. KR2-114]|uniref:YncE family protein n=1 Tax=Caulobacter sp. KR2-114 TaxID=3400912 RepID=UPI003C0DD869
MAQRLGLHPTAAATVDVAPVPIAKEPDKMHARTSRMWAALLACTALMGAASAHAGGVTTQTPGPDGPWDYAAFDAAHGRVLIARGFGVEALDVATGTLSQIAPGARVHTVRALPDGRLMITNGTAGTVVIANGATGAPEATIAVGKDPDAATFDAATGLILAMNADSGDVSLVDPAAGKEVARISVGGALEWVETDGAGRAFINVEDRAELVVLDIKGRKVLARYKLAGCEGPTAMGYVAPYRLLISACGNGHAKVLSADDGHQVADLAIGPHPDELVYDAQRGVAYIPTAGSATQGGEIAVVKVAGPHDVAVVGHIPTTRGARTIAEDPATGRLYLPTADYAITAEGKPKPVAGTFRILTVTP